MTFDAKTMLDKAKKIKQEEERKREAEANILYDKEIADAKAHLPKDIKEYEEKIEQASSEGQTFVRVHLPPYERSMLEDHFRKLGFRIEKSQGRMYDDGPIEDFHYIEWGEEEKLSTTQWNYKNRY